MKHAMPEAYLNLDAEDQKDIIQTAAGKLGRQGTVLEKDIWVCWALETLFTMPNAHPMAFKGGTSLSKVYGILDRFSEDVDITLSYSHFEDKDYYDYPNKFDPFAEGTSKNQISKYSNRLKSYVKSYATDVVVPYLEAELAKLKTAKFHTIKADELGEKIWVSYPSVAEETDEYLKSNVLIELGGRNVIDPNETHSITPYVADITKGVTYPSSDVTVLSPKRTFWEKATLIHVECNRDRLKGNPERLSRHWYDLVMLSRHESGQVAVNDRKLFEDVVHHKKVFFDSSKANYEACLQNSLQLIPKGDLLAGLHIDYEAMLNAGMMYHEPPKFSVIIDEIKHIEDQVNNWK